MAEPRPVKSRELAWCSGGDGRRYAVSCGALTVPIARKRSTRRLESYMTRGTVVKKAIWSCSLGWSLRPDPFGHNPPGLRQAFLDWR